MANDPFSNLEKTRNTKEQFDFYAALEELCQTSGQSAFTRAETFAAYAPRQIITAFLERYEIFKKIIHTPGDIFECGVGSGQGLMAFAHFASIFEPFCYTRRIVGFDTFSGFTNISPKDQGGNAAHMTEGGLHFDTYDMLRRAIPIHDRNRPIGHIEKVRLVKGDISQTLPAYLEANPATVISLLYLDMDLYHATRDTLNLCLARVPKGGVICFDELGHPDYPGETQAVMEILGLNNLRLRRLEISSTMSYTVVGEA